MHCNRFAHFGSRFSTCTYAKMIPVGFSSERSQQGLSKYYRDKRQGNRGVNGLYIACFISVFSAALTLFV